MTKQIFGLVGEFAAGKGTVARYLEARAGAVTFRFSDPLRDVLVLFNLEITRHHLQTLSTILRQHFGENILARAICKRVAEATASIVVIDGVRRLTDLDQLRDLPGFHLVAVVAAPETRYQRHRTRDENSGDSKMSFEEFLTKHSAEADRQIPEVVAMAADRLDNNGTFADLYAQVDRLLHRYHVTRSEN